MSDDLENDTYVDTISAERNTRYDREFKKACIRAWIAERLVIGFRYRFQVLIFTAGAFTWFFAAHGLAWNTCLAATFGLWGIDALLFSIKRFYIDTRGFGLGKPQESSIYDNRILGCASLVIGAYLLWGFPA